MYVSWNSNARTADDLKIYLQSALKRWYLQIPDRFLLVHFSKWKYINKKLVHENFFVEVFWICSAWLYCCCEFSFSFCSDTDFQVSWNSLKNSPSGFSPNLWYCLFFLHHFVLLDVSGKPTAFILLLQIDLKNYLFCVYSW